MRPLRSILFVSLAIAALATSGFSQSTSPTPASPADQLLGTWKTQPDGGDFAYVAIFRHGNVYSGKIGWLSQPDYPASEGPQWAGKPKVDRNNPDPSLRARPIIGLQILRSFTYDGGGVWSGGTIYDPKKGKTYRCKITLRPDGTLFVRGYIGFSWLGRTTVWTPVADTGGEPGGQPAHNP